MAVLIAEADATAPFVPHALHGADRSWPETNCYTDLWIELLASLGKVPEAAFGFAITQAFEGDQFTFSKIPFEDLRRLYGIQVQELSIYRTLEQHTALQVARGHVVLLEVDAFYLPDTAATTYRQGHVKTTIAVDAIDPADESCRYFHNAARGVLSGEDYRGAFRLRPELLAQPDLLPPYVEIAKTGPASADAATLRTTATALLRTHLAARPAPGPFACWRDAFAAHLQALVAAPDTFHDYAFHFPRAIGANFELFASHLRWLDPDRLGDAADASDQIAQTAKILQFRLARSVARRRLDPYDDCFDTFETAYAAIVSGLEAYLR